MRKPAVLVALSLLWLLSGCASLVPKLIAPDMTITRVQLGNTTSAGQQPVQLTVHAINPNDRAIAIRSIDAQLDVENLSFAQGTTAEGFVLPAKGEVDFDLDVMANINTAVVLLANRLGHRAANYRLYGTVHLKGGLLHNVPFDQKGRVKW
jgi:LEA14-like dessication related protein